MVSIQFLSNQAELFKQELKKRYMDTALIDSCLQKYELWKQSNTELDNLRQKKNEFNKLVITLIGDQKKHAIEEMKQTSDQIKDLEQKTKDLELNYQNLLALIPNLSWQEIPIGEGDSANTQTAVYNQLPEYDFTPLPYYELPIFKRDYLGQKGVEAAGYRGYYLVGELARLQQILFTWALQRLIQIGFEYVVPPILVNQELLYGTGFFPTGIEDIYEVKEGDKSKFLVGTSEAPLMFLYSNQVIDLQSPKKLVAFTPCFRKEVGAYGKDTKGGIRVHQFDKIETVFLTQPSQSNEVFMMMTDVFHQTLDLLNLHYRDLEVGSGDISIKNHRQIDIEGWFPGLGAFRELASSSNCTDYQTRTLNIKTDLDGQNTYAHSLNCTGLTNRVLFCLLEQNQQADGRVLLPQVLANIFGSQYIG